MSEDTLLLLCLFEVIGLAGLFVYSRRQARRRQSGQPRPPRIVRITVALFGLVVVVGAPALMISGIVSRANRGERLREELRETGTQSVAVINHIEETGTVINRQPEVRVYLTVKPEGQKPFDSEATWVFSVTDVQNYRVGTQVRVLFDPADRSEVAVVGLARSAP